MSRVSLCCFVALALIAISCQGAPPNAAPLSPEVAPQNTVKAPAPAPEGVRSANVTPPEVAQIETGTSHGQSPIVDPAPVSPAEALLDSMAVEAKERHGASEYALEVARRQRNEGDYQGAIRTLNDAARRDPNNASIRAAISTLGFLLGDRGDEIRHFADALRNRAQVADAQSILNLQRLYADGLGEFEAGLFERSAQTLHRVLEQLQALEARGGGAPELRAKIEKRQREAGFFSGSEGDSPR